MGLESKKAKTRSQLFIRATDAHRKGDLATAEALYLQILKARPNQFEVLHLLGVLQHSQGRDSEALSSLGAALKANPDFLPALLHHAVVLQALNRPAEAVASYDKALVIKPDCAEALYNRGNALRALKRTAEALASYDKVLAIKPDLAEGFNNRGNALLDLNRPAEAVASYDKALAIKPAYAEALYNRGNALRDLYCDAEALASYDGALAIKPGYAEALSSRGDVLQNLNRPVEALASYDKALAINPRDAGTLCSRGNALQVLERRPEALASYDQALTTDPDLVAAWLARGAVLQGMKRREEAILAYRQALAKGGDAEVIQYTLASLGAEVAPVTAPEKFVTKLFDQCAHRFDEQLVGKLKYRAPEFLFDMVVRFVPSRNLDILDLGCGTGLVGARLRPLARTLTGVDLSSNMLQIARRRQIYDDLICSELVEFLRRQTKAVDLAVAADVLIYFGDLSGVFHAVRGVLRDGGFFCFSVEAGEEQNFVLRDTCRYAHSAAYLRRLAEDHGFVLEAIEPKVIRQQDGSDVVGHLAILRCTLRPDHCTR
jgi:predicted TPR repeat methyltransferase